MWSERIGAKENVMSGFRFVAVIALVSALAWSASAVPALSAAPAITPDGQSGAQSGLSVTLHGSSLAAGKTRRSCFHFGAYVDGGAMVATASATTANVILRTVSTDLEHRSGIGWVYCAKITNVSGHASAFTLDARADLDAGFSLVENVGTLAAGATKSFCLPADPDHGWYEGPLVVSAASNHRDVILTTVSTTAKEHSVVGSGATATYCADIKNSSGRSSKVTIQASTGMHGSWFSQQVGTVNPNQSARACYPTNELEVPVVAAAESTRIGDITFTTLSTDREYRSVGGWVNCATMHMSGSTHTVGLWLEAVDGF
jgi:hypothetical protein